VKTAVAGQDPNWGRIVAAIGKSGAEADRDRLTIKLRRYPGGRKRLARPAYSEEAGAAYMQPELV
jgi:glutamate N-acetyltransferase/amino-acid N-acetyltransferase